MSSMDVEKPAVVIDLGAGDGALAGEASRRWNRARFITVDIDQNAASSSLCSKHGAAFSHYVEDALDAHLSARIGLELGAADSALCNPPYIKPKWRKHFAEILEDAGLSGVVPKIGCVPADVLFIAQNLRFLRTGGKLGLILPDGIIAGEKCSRLRQVLASAHRLERVIELPRRVFRDTEAKAHIVVLTKQHSPAGFITVQRLQVDGSLAPPIELPADGAAGRLDYSYLAAQSQTKRFNAKGVQLRALIESISRGSYSSAERRSCRFPVFHTTDFSSSTIAVPRSLLLSQSVESQVSGVIARPGDILVARVGRNLEEKVCYVEHGMVALTDCVLRIRTEQRNQAAVLGFLMSDAGRIALRAASHGVGAKFITREALLNLEIQGCDKA